MIPVWYADVRLCKLGGGWRLVKWMYQALFFSLSSQRSKEAQKIKKKNNAWSQVTFPGATIHDMKSHIIPTVERCPDQTYLYIGTNHLKSKEPNVVADAIVDLAREIENFCDAEIVLSEITTRNDAHGDVKAVTVDWSSSLGKTDGN